MNENDVKAISSIVGTAAGAVGAGSITVATITAPASGILGVLGFTTATTVALPVAGVVAAGGLLAFGAHKAYQAFKDNN